MQKIEKIFDSTWGLIIFYIIVAIVTLILIKGVNNISTPVAKTSEEQRTFYA